MQNQALRIAVVEDNVALLAVTLNALRLAGHLVQGAGSAEECLDLIDLHSLDLAVIDLNLPGRDGLWLARQLRAASPRVGIIMVTARVSLHDRTTGYGTGADIYISKPVETEELVAAVHSLGRRVWTAIAKEEPLLPLPEALPPRLREIANLLLQTGDAIKDIAGKLGIHEGTVRKHIERLYRALGVNSRAELSSRFSTSFYTRSVSAPDTGAAAGRHVLQKTGASNSQIARSNEGVDPREILRGP